MRKITTCVITGIVLAGGVVGALEADSKNYRESAVVAAEINWMTDFAAAQKIAKEQCKPIFLFFTGSDWCAWCKKLEKEVLMTDAFSKELGSRLVFVKVDFPLHGKIPDSLKEQNNVLKNKYNVRGFPTVVLINPNGERIAVTGYRAGGGQKYAEYLNNLIAEFESLQRSVAEIGKHSYTADELKALYNRARQIGCSQSLNKILDAGIVQKDNLFFLTEQYRILVEEDKIDTPQARKLRDQLITTNGDGAQEVNYRLAIIDFQELSEKADDDSSGDRTIAPLLAYVRAYGEKDPENLWKVHMMISQVMMHKNRLGDALQHAERSRDVAPTAFKGDVDKRIDWIKEKMKEAEAHTS